MTEINKFKNKYIKELRSGTLNFTQLTKLKKLSRDEWKIYVDTHLYTTYKRKLNWNVPLCDTCINKALDGDVRCITDDEVKKVIGSQKYV